MMRLNLVAAGLMAVLFTVPSSAQEVERYRLERTEDGYVRMDTQTGRLSVCRERDSQLVCQMAAEDQDAFAADYATLQERVEALQKRVTELEAKVGTPLRVLPNEEEFDRSLGMMEKFFRRFMGVIQDIEREGPPPPSDRT